MDGSQATLLPEWLQVVTPGVAFVALATIGLKVAWERVMKRRNGKNNDRGDCELDKNVVLLIQKVDRVDTDVQQTSKDVKEISQKVDALKLEVAGNYVKRDSLVSIGERIDDIRERTIKTETRIEMLERAQEK